MALGHGPVTSSGKSAPGPDPRIRHRIQIGMFRPIRVDHTNCLQVAIKTHSFSGQLTNIRNSDGAPEPDGALKVVVRKKVIHYRQLYIDRPEPIAFMPVAVDMLGRIYDDFLRLLFLHAHREASALTNDIPEESGHFRFLRAACLANIKGSVGLILAKASVMRISIPLHLSSRSFIPLPRFIHSRRPTTLLPPSLVFSPLCSP